MRTIGRTIFCLLTLHLMQIAVAQQPANVITSPRPLGDAALRLQEQYGKVVTYEEPLLTWRGELQAMPGRDPEAKQELFAKPQSFTMPGMGTDLGNALKDTMAAYHQATSGIRFQLLSSKLGFHIVPVEAHDNTGQSVPTTSLLDQTITVPTEARTAYQHLDALVAAINSVQPIRLVINIPFGFRPDSFDRAFRAQPPVFQWGVQSTVARDALIDLLNQSATTMSWHLMCQASAQASDRFCALNVGLIQVSTTDSQGKPAKTPLLFDRGR
jgi:hypothetical protein